MKKFSLLLASLMVSAGALAAAADMVTVDEPYVRLAPPNAPLEPKRGQLPPPKAKTTASA